MMRLVEYLSEFTIISFLFFCVFYLIRPHSTPTFRRYFLIGWLAFSALLPLISSDLFTYSLPKVEHTIAESLFEISPTDLQPGSSLVPRSAPFTESQDTRRKTFFEFPFSFRQLLIVCYLTISAFFIARVFIGFCQILRLKSSAKRTERNGTLIYLVNKPKFTGASFFNWIFMSERLAGGEFDIVLKHERLHSHLRHSADIVLAQVYRAVFWFHPFSWFLNSQISLNTELEADHYMVKSDQSSSYGRILLSLSKLENPLLASHFSGRHLKLRFIEMSSKATQKRWVTPLTLVLACMAFCITSCTLFEEDEAVINPERLSEVKTITTRFMSHQDDTQQKTGKIVSVVHFNLDGSFNEFSNQTSYPYDRDYETKRDFWDIPSKQNLLYVMDGLTLGKAENNLLYGNNWPSAYLKHLRNSLASEVLQNGRYREIITADSEGQPTEIMRSLKTKQSKRGSFVNLPDRLEFFKYENNRVISLSSAFGRNGVKINANESWIVKKGNDQAKNIKSKPLTSQGEDPSFRFHYDGDLLTSVEQPDGKRTSFIYDNGVLLSSTFTLSEGREVTRRYHYQDGLLSRIEISNIYNQPEYTIEYEYEFW